MFFCQKTGPASGSVAFIEAHLASLTTAEEQLTALLATAITSTIPLVPDSNPRPELLNMDD
jgi:hypothetical protein